ncbi:DUF2239 family protein [Rhodoferax sp.]|uniref:DUF2239 family protein n=1 Tax=Rhodoferax sp. TaxID=50421 RepID=UPI0025E3062A|nr:DUF2239 family protein [Rhodoferax sp.]
MAWLDTPSTAFEGSRRIASGTLREVALATKPVVDQWASSVSPPPILIFDAATSEVIDLDWRGSLSDVVHRLSVLAPAMDAANQPPSAEPEDEPVANEPRGRGRPKLGVQAREVTLLPRHWEWLASQPGGASVALRKLVEAARKSSETADRVRRSAAVTYKFMSTMASHEASFEEASRALFAGNAMGFQACIALWSADVQTHLMAIARDAFLTLEH